MSKRYSRDYKNEKHFNSLEDQFKEEMIRRKTKYKKTDLRNIVTIIAVGAFFVWALLGLIKYLIF